MQRREFIRQSAGFALAPAVLRRNYKYAEEFAQKKARVGLIGTGWYGKSDLFRLLQVAPVEIVSLCDVDKKMLADCAEQVAGRQESKKTGTNINSPRQKPHLAWQSSANTIRLLR